MMAATMFLPANPRLPGTRSTITDTRRRNRQRAVVIMNAQRGESEGKSVDENMVVLRMRIERIKAIEGVGGEEPAPPLPPEEWKEWEKKVFTQYNKGVSDSVEMLQEFLMNTRPSVAVGMMALIAMAVPLSSSVVFGNIIKVAKGLLAGCHVCIDIDFN